MIFHFPHSNIYNSLSHFQGWYIVTYAVAIYHLNLFIAFLTPKVDPSVYQDDSDGMFSGRAYTPGAESRLKPTCDSVRP